MTEKRLISWEELQVVQGDYCYLGVECEKGECEQHDCYLWAKLEIPPKLTNYSTNQLVVLSNQLIHERDEITKRRAEVQDSCEHWRSKCYELEEQIKILKQRIERLP